MEIHRSVDSLSGYTLLTLLGNNVEMYIDTPLVFGTKYYYKVRAVKDDQLSDFSNIVSAGRNFTLGTVSDYEGNEFKSLHDYNYNEE